MWPFLVGVELDSSVHFEEVNARLALLGAKKVTSGVWLVYCDQCPEALRFVLQVLLDDCETFFLAPVEEILEGQNLAIGRL